MLSSLQTIEGSQSLLLLTYRSVVQTPVLLTHSPVPNCSPPTQLHFFENFPPNFQLFPPLKLRFWAIESDDIPKSLPILRNSCIIPLNFHFFSYIFQPLPTIPTPLTTKFEKNVPPPLVITFLNFSPNFLLHSFFCHDHDILQWCFKAFYPYSSCLAFLKGVILVKNAKNGLFRPFWPPSNIANNMNMGKCFESLL